VEEVSLPERYTVRKLLGEGGMGQVVLAFDEELGREVAVKVLAPWRQDERMVARFRRESEDLARLSHLNVVRFVAGGHHQGRDYLVMDYIPGRDLRSVCRTRTPRSIVQLFLQVCEGLKHIHEQGLVHRDLKPHNVLVSPDGVARITDLGLARRVEAWSSLTGVAVVGSEDYMAPEQATTSKVGPAADLYALGVCLFEALTGQLPAPGVLPRTLRPELSVELSTLLLSLLKPKPDRRPASVDEVIRALRACPELEVELGPEPPSLPEGSAVLTGPGRFRALQWLYARQQGRTLRLGPRVEKPLESVLRVWSELGGEPEQLFGLQRLGHLAGALAERLAGCTLLVDDYEALTPTTRELVQELLKTSAHVVVAAESLAGQHVDGPEPFPEDERSLEAAPLALLRAGALLEQPFDLELAALAGGLDWWEAELSVGRLRRAGLVEPVWPWEDGVLRFTSRDVRERVAAAVVERTRKRVCVTAARHLVEQGGPPAAIATLYARAGYEAEAERYRAEAAALAAERGAPADVI